MGRRLLLVRIGGRLFGLPLEHVGEVFRPLPTQRVADAPFGVVGLAVVRGRPTPVVDLAAGMGDPPSVAGRYVTLRDGDRSLALAVSDVLSVSTVADEALEAPASLLQALSPEAIEALGRVGGEVLRVLAPARLLEETADVR